MNDMINIISGFINLIADGTQADAAVDPLYKAISTIGPYAMGVVLALGLIYGIILGYNFCVIFCFAIG